MERSYESVDVATGKLLAREPGVWMESAAVLPDQQMLYLPLLQPEGYRTNELWEVRTDAATGAFRGHPRKIASPLKSTGSNDPFYALSATADGKQVMVLRRSNLRTVFVADLEGSPPQLAHTRRLTFDERASYPHAWTADSGAVIFESDRNGTYDIFRQRLDRRTPDVIVATPLQEVLPHLAPDGRSILYAAGTQISTPPVYKLMRVPVEGGPPQEVLIGGPLDEFRCALKPGHRCVLRTVTGHQCFAFYELDPVRGKGRELARIAWQRPINGDWDLSPDGTEVAIPNHDSGSARIRVAPLVGGAPREREVVLPGLNNLSSVVWAQDGKGWFVSIDTEIGGRLFYVSRDSRLHLLGDFQGFAVPSPDGRKLAFVDRIGATNAWIINRR